MRTLRSAGRIYFRYRSEIASEGRRITLVSGGRQYRELVRKLYPLIADAKLVACIGATDVHEYGKLLVQEALARLGVSVIDLGVHAEPEDHLLGH